MLRHYKPSSLHFQLGFPLSLTLGKIHLEVWPPIKLLVTFGLDKASIAKAPWLRACGQEFSSVTVDNNKTIKFWSKWQQNILILFFYDKSTPWQFHTCIQSNSNMVVLATMMYDLLKGWRCDYGQKFLKTGAKLSFPLSCLRVFFLHSKGKMSSLICHLTK